MVMLAPFSDLLALLEWMIEMGKELGELCVAGEEEEQGKSPFFSLLAQYLSACHDVISEIKAEVGIDSRHS